ncbi:hypothetical protein M1N53_02875, partial [Thermodesulfovibrionales bacterium]|nr:hypothetical protein [Thermodesulfovibrionales bacterium]
FRAKRGILVFTLRTGSGRNLILSDFCKSLRYIFFIPLFGKEGIGEILWIIIISIKEGSTVKKG